MDGTGIIVDDGLSRNGTFVNGERLGGRRRLRDGDAVLRRDPDDVPLPADRGPGRNRIAGDEPRAVTLNDPAPSPRGAVPPGGRLAFATPATNQQIAEELYLSVDAVKTHLRTLFAKFGLEDLPQNQKRIRLVERAFYSGVISERDL